MLHLQYILFYQINCTLQIGRDRKSKLYSPNFKAGLDYRERLRSWGKIFVYSIVG